MYSDQHQISPRIGILWHYEIHFNVVFVNCQVEKLKLYLTWEFKFPDVCLSFLQQTQI